MTQLHYGVASIDKATSGDGVHSLVLKIELSDDKAVELFDTVWCDELRQLSDKHDGVAINSKELRAGVTTLILWRTTMRC